MKVHSSYCYSPLASSCFPASVCSSQPNRVSADCWHVTNTRLLHFGLWGGHWHASVYTCRVPYKVCALTKRQVKVDSRTNQNIFIRGEYFSCRSSICSIWRKTKTQLLSRFYLYLCVLLYLWLSWPTSAPSCASGCFVVRRSTRPSPSPSSLWPCARGVPASRGHSARSLTGFWRGTQTD